MGRGSDALEAIVLRVRVKDGSGNPFWIVRSAAQEFKLDRTGKSR